MGVRRKALAGAGDLGPEMVELFLAQAAFHEGAGVNPRCRVPLEIHQVAADILVRCPEKMVEAHVVEHRRGGETADVAAEFRGLAVRPHHHRHGVPAHIGAQPVLQGQVAGAPLFQVGGDGVDVGGVGRIGQVGTGAAGLVHQVLDQEMGAFHALGFDYRRQGIQPFTGFLGIGIGSGVSSLGGHQGFHCGHGDGLFRKTSERRIISASRRKIAIRRFRRCFPTVTEGKCLTAQRGRHADRSKVHPDIS